MSSADHKTTIAVIIPAYNVEQWIGECIDSVLLQTVKFDEILIINDGSTDNTFEICQQYAKENNTIKLFDQENRGLGAARNFGVERAESDYYIFLDSDDKLDLKACEQLHAVADMNRLDVLYFDGVSFGDEELFDGRAEYYSRSGGFSGKVLQGKTLFRSMYPDQYRDSACLAMYNKEFVHNNDLSFPEGIFHEDISFSFMIIHLAERAMHKPLSIYKRRYREGSITNSSFSERHFYGLAESSKIVWEFILDRGMEFEKESFLYSLSLFVMLTDRMNFLDTPRGGIKEGALSVFCRMLLEIDKKYALSSDVDDLRMQMLISLLRLKLIDSFAAPDEVESLVEKYKEWGMSFIDSVFALVPFAEPDKRIGIYGVGKCTEEMLHTYSKMHGEIKAGIYYIDTDGSKKQYKGKRIYGYEEMRGLVDVVVVSSSKYHSEISEIVRKNVPEIRMVDPYERMPFPYFSVGKMVFGD